MKRERERDFLQNNSLRGRGGGRGRGRGGEGGGVGREREKERERDFLLSPRISFWGHSSHDRLIGRGVPGVSFVSCYCTNKQFGRRGNPEVPIKCMHTVGTWVMQ